MYPVFTILGRNISGYALMGVLGFAACIIYLIIACRKYRYTFDDAFYITAFAIIGAMLGAKLLYLITVIPNLVEKWPVFVKHPLEVIKPYFYGGMVFYGGLFGGIGGAYAASRYFEQNLRENYQIFVPIIPLFAGFGRLGCLMVGCCYGRHTDSAFHIIFNHSAYAPNNTPLIPTQLYEAIFDFCLFAALAFLGYFSEIRRNLLRIYLFSYAVFRFIIEFFRGDGVRGVYLLSTSQWISAIILGFLAVDYFYLQLKKKQKIVSNGRDRK